MGHKNVKCFIPDLAVYVILKVSFLNFIQKLNVKVPGLKTVIEKVTFYEINGEIWAKYFSKSNFCKRAQAVLKYIYALLI
jgi:hypothetical protein